MKVLILANSDQGLYKFRKELIDELVGNHDVYICLPEGNFINELVSLGCHFMPCSILDRHGVNPNQELKLLKWYTKTIKDLHPDIVLTYTIKPNIYGGMACSKLGIPYVVNITGLGSAIENPGVLQSVTLGLYKFALRKAQKVFFQNSANKVFFLSRKIVKGPYDLLPGSGVNLVQFTVAKYPEDDEFHFLFIGRIMRDKGVDELFECMRGLADENCHVLLDVVGSYE